VSEGTRSRAKVMSLVIEYLKSPYDLLRYMFGLFSGFSPSNRSTHVGIDKRRYSLGLHRKLNQVNVKQPQNKLGLNNAKCTPGFEIYNEFEEF